MDDLVLLAALPPEAVAWLIALWLFALGGVFGSFFNVVVYRLPAGMSLVKPGSHCPACKHAIRWFDNVPMLGWMILRGRCRDCGAAISARYPIVETITATLFLVLGILELLGDGANLPWGSGRFSEEMSLPPRTLAEQYGIYFFHLLLLCTLLLAVLFEYDGHRPPLRLFGPAIFGGILAPIVLLELHPVSVVPESAGWLGGLADGVLGLATGTGLGLLAKGVSGGRQHGLIGCAACVGLFLGCQAAMVLIVLSAVVHLVVLGLGWLLGGVFPKRLPATTWLALGTLGWILLWAPLVARFPILG